ncbi:transposase, partial [Marinibactrum halimedae]|nr:transposase [Marinibactrum halimedae]
MSKSDLPFDLEDAIAHIKAGKPLTGKEGLLTPLIKQVTEAALQAEQEQHIANS